MAVVLRKIDMLLVVLLIIAIIVPSVAISYITGVSSDIKTLKDVTSELVTAMHALANATANIADAVGTFEITLAELESRLAALNRTLAGLLPKPKLLRVGFAWPTEPDPAVGSDYSSSTTFTALYDPLVYPTAAGDIIPWVAENWTVSADGLTWNFTIKEGIKFHSNRTLGAKDVAFSMDRMTKIGVGYGYLFIPFVNETKVLDDYNVQFVLKKQFGPFLYSLVRLYIVDKEEIMAHIVQGGTYDYPPNGDLGRDWLLTHDAGSGPYKVKEIKREQYIDMVRFNDYWAPMPPNAADEITYMALAVPATERTMMSKRELEITSQWLSEEVYAALDGTGGIDVTTFPGGDEFYYMMNNKKPPLDDIYVRRALAYVVDYEKIVRDVYPASLVATSCVPVGTPGYVSCQIYHTDVNKALEELSKSKYYPDIVQHPENYVIEVDWCAEVPPEEKIAMIFAECVERDLGLRVDVVETPWGKMIEDMTTEATSPHIETIFVALHYSEAGSLIESRYHSKSAPTWEQNEWLLNSTLDAAIEDALSTVDKTERFSKYAELERTIIAMCPSLFLFDHMIKMAYQTYIDWPAARGEVIPIMGYNIDPRTIQIYPPS